MAIADARSQPAALSEAGSPWRKGPAAPLLLSAAFFTFLLLPQMWEKQRLLWSFVGVGGALVAWAVVLCTRRKDFRIELAVFKTHYVQAIVQGSIYVYWGMTDPNVYREVPLILFQMFFLYILVALISWGRGHSWRLGFGPMPIILSTNLLLCFRHEWYIFQFVMITIGVLGKEFIKWNRGGKRTHIFNPSVFGQVAVAVFLISTGTTDTFTYGKEIAASFESVPHMLVLIFLLGLVVQYMFAVTLMTLAGATVIVLVNLIYFKVTGTYYFISINIGATIFLGLHLLVTDPSTSPRSNLGRVVFGALYGAGYCIIFRILSDHDVPLFWDKLLPVPILNLSVKLFDQLASIGIAGRLSAWWQAALEPRKLNFVHMACWGGLFGALLGTGFVDAPHPGESLYFWKRALDEKRPRAGRNLLQFVKYGITHDNGEACNMMGVLLVEGKLATRSGAAYNVDGESVNQTQAAAHYFAKACEFGFAEGCVNVTRHVIHRSAGRSAADVQRAFDTLEVLEQGPQNTTGEFSFLLGFAYELGKGRPLDRQRAQGLYQAGCAAGYGDACKGVARIQFSSQRTP